MEQNRIKYAAMILTHGRADRVITYKTLRRSGYTGPIYLVVDDHDDQIEDYKSRYPGEVIIYNKDKYINATDTIDNFGKTGAVIFARNAAYDIAKDLGYEYFIELDDDYHEFSYRFNSKQEFKQKAILNLDIIFDAMMEYYRSVNIKTIAFIQTGDLVGGMNNGSLKNNSFPFIKRKAMNLFFCSTKRRINFIGTINEDVNSYALYGSRGDLFLTTPLVCINQQQTQSNAGGMTELYLDQGTYVKSFYSVIVQPSSVKIMMMGEKHQRLHHSVIWNNTIPYILRQSHKKC